MVLGLCVHFNLNNTNTNKYINNSTIFNNSNKTKHKGALREKRVCRRCHSVPNMSPASEVSRHTGNSINKATNRGTRGVCGARTLFSHWHAGGVTEAITRAVAVAVTRAQTR